MLLGRLKPEDGRAGDGPAGLGAGSQSGKDYGGTRAELADEIGQSDW